MRPQINLRIVRSQSRPLTPAHWNNLWICKAYRTRALSRATFSTSSPKLNKPYYVTTPIFYVNAAPHVGHLYTMVLTDILKRWQTLQGNRAILCTGTDEHGMKIQKAAAIAGKEPKEFCDITSETFKDLAKKAGIANDHFVRTSDTQHKDAVQFFWTELQSRGYIYESKHEGWYCVSDETFYPESAIEKRLDPYTGRTFMASVETKQEVEWTSERNYHFRLSAFKDQLLEYYKSNPTFVIPSSRMADVVNAVSSGLEDLSISRPVERLQWGVSVPNDPTQTIYVWLDALINYITKAGYPWVPGQESDCGWPADVQVIGKDIVRFHCIYWPAFLMAVGIKPPKQILTHAHWTLDRQKMSKSTGNVVNPFFALERFGVDLMRFYLAYDGGIANDSDYGNKRIVARYKKCLSGGLGNLASRVMRAKKWNVKTAVKNTEDIAHLPRPLRGNATTTHIAMLESLPGRVETKMTELNVGAALQIILEAVFETNQYIAELRPWRLADMLMQLPVESQGEVQFQLDDAIYHCAETLRIVGILLQPFIPSKAATLLDMLGVDGKKRAGQFAVYGCDFDYGSPQKVLEAGVYDSLFPLLPMEN